MRDIIEATGTGVVASLIWGVANLECFGERITQIQYGSSSGLSQIIQTTQNGSVTNYLYGLERLASVSGSTKTWYGTDALGSVRQTTTNTGLPLDTFSYDPWGTPQGTAPPTFGFTSELQDAGTGLVNLRAR